LDSLEEADSCNDSVLPCYSILSAVDEHKCQWGMGACFSELSTTRQPVMVSGRVVNP